MASVAHIYFRDLCSMVNVSILCNHTVLGYDALVFKVSEASRTI